MTWETSRERRTDPWIDLWILKINLEIVPNVDHRVKMLMQGGQLDITEKKMLWGVDLLLCNVSVGLASKIPEFAPILDVLLRFFFKSNSGTIWCNVDYGLKSVTYRVASVICLCSFCPLTLSSVSAPPNRPLTAWPGPFGNRTVRGFFFIRPANMLGKRDKKRDTEWLGRIWRAPIYGYLVDFLHSLTEGKTYKG